MLKLSVRQTLHPNVGSLMPINNSKVLTTNMKENANI